MPHKTATPHKRAAGVYYTRGNPFVFPQFRHWARRAGLPAAKVLEPFAGGNAIVNHLQRAGLCRSFQSYDIQPAAKGVVQRDTLAAFPRGYGAVVTNPPWLAKNSAKRRGLPFPQTPYDNLYKHALALCLANAPWVAAIIPASFIQAKALHERLCAITFLTGDMFAETENPACLALFQPGAAAQKRAYHNKESLGLLCELEARAALPRRGQSALRFNTPQGALGLHAVDNTKAPSIRFCLGSEIAPERVKHTSRSITRIGTRMRVSNALVGELNRALFRYRTETKDVFLTPFKGVRADGMYRRRLDYETARMLINQAQATC